MTLYATLKSCACISCIVMTQALLTSCAVNLPTTVPAVIGKTGNSCLPEAVLVAETLKQQHFKARVLIINTTAFSHAIVVYQSGSENPSLWIWDSANSAKQVEAGWEDSHTLATQWLDTNRVNEKVTNSYFL